MMINGQVFDVPHQFPFFSVEEVSLVDIHPPLVKGKKENTSKTKGKHESSRKPRSSDNAICLHHRQ
jgi:hypothetical protein